MIVIGIDPSLSGTGVCSNDGHVNEFSAKSQGQRARDRADRHQRLADLVRDAVLVSKAAARFKLDVHVFLEGYSFGSKGSAVTNLAEYRGVLLAALLPHVASLTEVAPGTLKKFACGKGSADKVAVATALTQRYGLAFASDNMADAFALMKLGMCVEGLEVAQTKVQAEVVAKVQQSRAA